MTNKWNSTLYIGVTRNLEGRVLQHKNKVNKCFTSQYNIFKLVYFEENDSVIESIVREKLLKRWRREWKEDLIRSINSGWIDLAKDWHG